MVSIWWIGLALFAGFFLGALVVGLMSINVRDEEWTLEVQPDEKDVPLVA